MDSPDSQPQPRGSLGRELLLAAGGWSLIGASIGALVGALAVKVNSSLQGPDQAAPFVALCVASYAAILLGFGLLVGLAGHFSRRSRPGFLVHARAAIVGFAGFAGGQFL